MTGLEQPGSLIRYQYRPALTPGTDLAVGVRNCRSVFRRRMAHCDVENALRAFNVSSTGLHYSCIDQSYGAIGGRCRRQMRCGLSWNPCHFDRGSEVPRRKSANVFRVYFLQVAAMSAVGILIGLSVGVLAPNIASPCWRVVCRSQHGPVSTWNRWRLRLPSISCRRGLYLMATWSRWRNPGGCTLPQHDRAPFRSSAAVYHFPHWHPRGADCLLAVATATRPDMAGWYIAGATLVFLIFRLFGEGVRGPRRLPRPRQPLMRLALANLHRPGVPTRRIAVAWARFHRAGRGGIAGSQLEAADRAGLARRGTWLLLYRYPTVPNGGVSTSCSGLSGCGTCKAFPCCAVGSSL